MTEQETIPEVTFPEVDETIDYDCPQINNDPMYEVAWACQAAERASVHMKILLQCADIKNLTLHKKGDEIYEKFREIFPEMNVENVTENELKFNNKVKWFVFCQHFTDIEEHNFGTLMRMRANGAYSEENTIVVPKIIYMAIEMARNKEGINDLHRQEIKDEHDRIQKEGGNMC